MTFIDAWKHSGQLGGTIFLASQELFVREKLGEMNEVLWYERSQSTPPLHGLFYPLLLLLLLC